jgi:hypothetical protein
LDVGKDNTDGGEFAGLYQPGEWHGVKEGATTQQTRPSFVR